MKLKIDEPLRNTIITVSTRNITIRYIPSPGRIKKLMENGKTPSLLLIIEKDGQPAKVLEKPIRDFTPIELSTTPPEPPFTLHLLLTIPP